MCVYISFLVIIDEGVVNILRCHQSVLIVKYVGDDAATSRRERPITMLWVPSTFISTTLRELHGSKQMIDLSNIPDSQASN